MPSTIGRYYLLLVGTFWVNPTDGNLVDRLISTICNFKLCLLVALAVKCVPQRQPNTYVHMYVLTYIHFPLHSVSIRTKSYSSRNLADIDFKMNASAVCTILPFSTGVSRDSMMNTLPLSFKNRDETISPRLRFETGEKLI